MKFTVVVFACLLAAVAAQFERGQYYQRDQYNNNRYNNQYNPFNNQYNKYNRNQNYNAYKPFVSSTPFPPRPAVVAEASASIAPPVVPVPVVPKASPAPAPAPVPVVAAVSVSPAPVPVVPVPVAKVASSDRDAQIVKYGNEINPDGSFNYYFESNNGIAAQEQGVPRNFGGNPPVVPDVAQGSFSWISPEGVPIAISYVADENGYQPTGNAIPVAPEIPPQIARALEYIARSLKN